MTTGRGRQPYLLPEELVEKKPEPRSAVGVNSRLWDDLAAVAGYDRGAVGSLVLQIAAIAAVCLAPERFEQYVFFVSVIASLISAICVFAIGTKVFPVLIGIFLGIVSLTPTFGFVYRDFVGPLGPAKYLLFARVGLAGAVDRTRSGDSGFQAEWFASRSAGRQVRPTGITGGLKEIAIAR